jgi:hypothetical protein
VSDWWIPVVVIVAWFAAVGLLGGGAIWLAERDRKYREWQRRQAALGVREDPED